MEVNRHQLYNKYKRDQDAKRFYNSKAWEVVRTLALNRDYYLCQECMKNKSIVVYDVVHHIKSRKDYPELALTLENLISLCHACHNKIESEGEIRDRGINIIETEDNPEII